MIYLDNNATTRPSDEVVAAMNVALRERWHNPSSVHRAGQDARREVELARESLARLIGASAKSLTLCSGGTEAIDLAVRGVRAGGDARRNVIVTTAVEHAAVRELCEELHKREGVEVRLLPLDREGVVDVAALGRVIDERVRVVSVQWANNETGAVQPIREIAALARSRGALVHCDATQWVGKMPTDVGEGGGFARDQTPWLDLLTFAPHKFHGPKGVGVLWTRRGVAVTPQMVGTQEQGRRGGTENVAGIVGAGVAAELAMAWLADGGARTRARALRDGFEARVLEALPAARVNGPRDSARRLWNTTNIGFPKLEAEALLLVFSERGLAASAGAACSSGSLDPSPVLLAMGVAPEYAHGSIRFSLSRETTAADVDAAVRIVVEGVRRVGGA